MDIKELFINNILAKEFNKALAAIDKREYYKAIVLLKKVLRKQEFKEAWLNLGVAYKGTNNLSLAADCFHKAIDADMPFSDTKFSSNWPVALTNLGLVYYCRELDSLAEECYLRALKEDPMYYDAIWNLSIVKLRQYCSRRDVDLGLAWTYYSYRFKRKGAEPLKSMKTDLELWDYSNSGNSIVVLMEQGMGDAMMFGRYLKYLEKYFSKIWIQCTPEMDYLFTDYLVCRDPIDTDAAVGVPMCSLGRLVNWIPDGNWLSGKYIAKKKEGPLEIMCIWGGTSTHTNSANRDAPAGLFDELAKYGNLHSVQKRKGYTLIPVVDWKTTIEYLEKIDLVITIDSSVAHLCGSLGKPCLVLMPLNDTDFRWGDTSMGTDNLWYKSVKVIRNSGDWVNVFDQVKVIVECLK